MGWFQQIFHRPTPSTPATEEEPRATGRRSAPPPPERLTALTLSRFLKEHPRVVVDVWAPWCAPCRAFAPVFAATAREWGHDVGFGKIHADHEPSLVTRFGVRSIPSLLFFRDGKLVHTETGVLPPDRFDKRLHRVFRDLR